MCVCVMDGGGCTFLGRWSVRLGCARYRNINRRTGDGVLHGRVPDGSSPMGVPFLYVLRVYDVCAHFFTGIFITNFLFSFLFIRDSCCVAFSPRRRKPDVKNWSSGCVHSRFLPLAPPRLSVLFAIVCISARLPARPIVLV